ncbi:MULTISPECIES: polymorphic toxin type 44 domain-containing protein [unclassified Pseudodesulfovibrio]|uniref:polymorphic toxin type 44 domain-containing protein n=1 Tax=unclassified Pseudodesulfovibrio TaxID=2661612 RepID=UPI000FEBBBCD|nr:MULTISPECIES: polymorphic toxin type 44 domain-containing protein [unclassified Pseudodesulfovibrio]RWU04109.1 hypothetical protein DWB63_08870 [Pseudodesulfovibrio sp. S3]
MSEQWVQHIGENQLVYGMPKHMSATATGKSYKTTDPDALKKYWRYHPKPKACDKCQAMNGLWFEENPGPVHPNCKCEIEVFTAYRVSGRAEAMIVPPGVDLSANIAEAKRIAKECQQKAAKEVDDFLEKANFSGVHSIDSIRAACIDELTFLYKCSWIYDNFRSEQNYDYKKEGHPEYEDFGNYHYGLYTQTMGINVTFARAAAGAWQLKKDTHEWRWYRTWFDDPRDNQMIRKGQDYPF